VFGNSRCWILAALWGAVGCSSGQSGADFQGTVCVVVDSAVTGADQATPVGTPSDLVALATGEQHLSLQWYGHTDPPKLHETVFTMEVLPEVASARYLAQMPALAGQSGLSCPDMLTIDATLRLDTADGVFAERFAGTLRKEAPFGVVSFEGTLPAGDLQGSYDDTEIAAGFVNPLYVVRSTLKPDVRGNLFMNGEDPDNDPNTIKGSPFIAEWPVPPQP
jgi:hypothetical protein